MNYVCNVEYIVLTAESMGKHKKEENFHHHPAAQSLLHLFIIRLVLADHGFVLASPHANCVTDTNRAISSI